MIETFRPATPRPGALVHVDPHLEALLAFNLLDEEPGPAPWLPEPPRVPHAARGAEERIPVLSG